MSNWQFHAQQELEEVGFKPKYVFSGEIQVKSGGKTYRITSLSEAQEFADLAVLGGDLSHFEEDW